MQSVPFELIYPMLKKMEQSIKAKSFPDLSWRSRDGSVFVNETVYCGSRVQVVGALTQPIRRLAISEA